MLRYAGRAATDLLPSSRQEIFRQYHAFAEDAAIGLTLNDWENTMKFKPGDRVVCKTDAWADEAEGYIPIGPVPRKGTILTVNRVGLSKDGNGMAFWGVTCLCGRTKVEVGYDEAAFESYVDEIEIDIQRLFQEATELIRLY